MIYYERIKHINIGKMQSLWTHWKMFCLIQCSFWLECIHVLIDCRMELGKTVTGLHSSPWRVTSSPGDKRAAEPWAEGCIETKARKGAFYEIGLDFAPFLHDLLVEYFNFHGMLLGSNRQGNSVIPEAGNDGLLGETAFTGGWSEHHLALVVLFFC